jgi:hypothetical protein
MSGSRTFLKSSEWLVQRRRFATARLGCARTQASSFLLIEVFEDVQKLPTWRSADGLASTSTFGNSPTRGNPVDIVSRYFVRIFPETAPSRSLSGLLTIRIFDLLGKYSCVSVCSTDQRFLIGRYDDIQPSLDRQRPRRAQ